MASVQRSCLKGPVFSYPMRTTSSCRHVAGQHNARPCLHLPKCRVSLGEMVQSWKDWRGPGPGGSKPGERSIFQALPNCHLCLQPGMHLCPSRLHFKVRALPIPGHRSPVLCYHPLFRLQIKSGGLSPKASPETISMSRSFTLNSSV